jgi:hypothetical protein
LIDTSSSDPEAPIAAIRDQIEQDESGD